MQCPTIVKVAAWITVMGAVIGVVGMLAGFSRR